MAELEAVTTEDVEGIGMVAGHLHSPKRAKPPQQPPSFPTRTVRLQKAGGRSSNGKVAASRKLSCPITAVDRMKAKANERSLVQSEELSGWMTDLRQHLDKALSNHESTKEDRLRVMREAFDEVIEKGPQEFRPLLAEIQYEYEAAIFRAGELLTDDSLATQNPQEAMELGMMKQLIEETKTDMADLHDEIASIEEEIRLTNLATADIEKAVRTGQIIDAIPRSKFQATEDATGVQSLHDQISETVLKINGIEKHHREDCVPASVVEWLQRSVVEAQDQKSQLQAQNELLALDIADLKKRHDENPSTMEGDNIQGLFNDYEDKKRTALEHADDLFAVEDGW